jgi:hypothetical protein
MRGIANPFKVMFVILIIAVAGLTGIIAVFVASHPDFSPFQNRQLPKGWIDANTYVSNNFSIVSGNIARDVFGYGGAGGQSIMILGIQPLTVDKIGDIEIEFNGIRLGQTKIESTLVVNTSVASCCFVTLVQAGVDNVVEIASKGFEGNFRYLIIIPTR